LVKNHRGKKGPGWEESWLVEMKCNEKRTRLDCWDKRERKMGEGKVEKRTRLERERKRIKCRAKKDQGEKRENCW